MTRLEITVALIAARPRDSLERLELDEQTGITSLYRGDMNERDYWYLLLRRDIKDCELIADEILASFVAHEEGREWPDKKELK